MHVTPSFLRPATGTPRLLLFLLFASFMFPACSGSGGNKPIKVLIVTGMDHPAHDWKTTSAAVRQELLKDPRMQVGILDNPYRLDSVQLHGNYDVVFLNFNNWEQPDPGEKAQENLQTFVAGGGGLVLMHFACGAFLNWEEFPHMAGKVWDQKNAHDPRGKFTVKLADTTHPITRGMESYVTDDELYTCLTGSEPVRLLATAQSVVSHDQHPMAFTLTYHKGKVFHTTLGHDARAVQVPGTSRLLRNGVAWAAGREPHRESSHTSSP